MRAAVLLAETGIVLLGCGGGGRHLARSISGGTDLDGFEKGLDLAVRASDHS